MYKKLLVALLLFGCKPKQVLNRLPHLREDGFYYQKYDGKNINDAELMRFHKNGYMVALAFSGTAEELNKDSRFLACLLDTVMQQGTTLTSAIYHYTTKRDSIFFKKKNWDFYQFYYNLSFACKLYTDSLIARITPVDYDTTDTSPHIPAKSYTATFKFKQALCDTGFSRTIPNRTNQQ